MGEGRRRTRLRDERQTEVLAYIDGLTPRQRVLLQSALARRRPSEGNAPLDVPALQAIIEDFDLSAEDDEFSDAYEPEPGATCPCGAPAGHRLEVAAWATGEFKRTHRPAIIPIGGVFFCGGCEAHKDDVPEDVRTAIDGQLAEVGKAPRDWSRIERRLIALEESVIAPRPALDEMAHVPEWQATCAHAGCNAMASHRPRVVVPALAGVAAADPHTADLAVWFCEAHALGFTIPEHVRTTIDTSLAQNGLVPADWAAAHVEAVPGVAHEQAH